MRYFLRKGQQIDELTLRREYLYEVFKLWFVKAGEIGSFDVLEAFPYGRYDLLLIYGHNGEIAHLFEEHATELKEKNIAIISCTAKEPEDYLLKGKNVFLAPQDQGQAKLLAGKEFGFSFDITRAELQLYKSRIQDPIQKIEHIFTKIQ